MGRHVILVTGAARSGKSEWAETLALRSQQSVVYVATAQLDSTDDEWQRRIAQHRQRRSPDWQTLDVPLHLTATIRATPANVCLLVDSLGTWVANWLEQDEATWDDVVHDLLLSLNQVTNQVIFVAEEVGWGVVPSYPIGRLFRDRLGNLTRRLGAVANLTYLVTAGHVLNLTALGQPLEGAIAAHPTTRSSQTDDQSHLLAHPVTVDFQPATERQHENGDRQVPGN